MTIINFKRALENDVKTGKYTEEIKPRLRYVCDTSKSFIYYPARDGEDKSNMPMSRDTKNVQSKSVSQYNKRIAYIIVLCHKYI